MDFEGKKGFVKGKMLYLRERSLLRSCARPLQGSRGSRYRVTVPRILSSGSSWCTKRSRQIIGSLGAQVKCQSL